MQRIISCAPMRVCAFGLRHVVFFAALITSLIIGSVTDAQIAVGPSQPMVTQPISESNLVTLSGNTRAEAQVAANDQGALTDDAPMPHMMLQLRRPPAQEDALNALIDQLHDPASPNYHQWLTAAEIGERFGPAPSDIQAVTGWLSQYGFAVNTVYTNRMVIDFSGTAGQVHTAFHTEIHSLNVDGVAHFANISDPQIPAALAPVVVGIVSLNDFRPVPQFVHNDAPAANYTASPNYYMTPGDLATIYNFKPLFARGAYGASQTIYVIENSTMYSLNDWSYFRDVFQLPDNVGGGLTEEFPAPPTGPNNCNNPGVNGSDGEATLDVEWATAAAPAANIVLAACADTGVATSGILIAVQNLINGANPPAIISISYGICEVDAGATMNAAINTVFQTGVAEGASIFVSAGDQGAAGCTPGGTAAAPNTVNTGIGVNAWASTPYAVAVGGTDFADTYLGMNSTYWNATNSTDFSSAKSYIPEVPWDTTCANQEWASSNGYGYIFGSTGFCDSSYIASNKYYLNNWAASGGPSGCATGAPSVSYVVSGTCAGRAKPSWQSGLVGVPNDGVRDVPDVSLFSSFGPWNHSYLICFSDPARNGTGVACNSVNSTSLMSTGWGGTSFAAPIWAGIQSIINDAAFGRQGNPNYRLYQIAKAEYGANANEPCNSSLNPSASCVFYDVTRGDTAVPCVADGGTYYNCYHPSGTYGVLSQDNCCYEPAYFAGFGWDFATGIGTVNVANLVAAWAPKTDSHDFNADSVSDILWRDASGNVGIWLMNIYGQESSVASVAQVPTSWSVVGTRDFNGDRKADILWLDSSGNVAVWLMNGTTLSAGITLGNVGTNWAVAGTGDFNGDGTGDILWRNTQSGDFAIWMMRNGQYSSAVDLGVVSAAWQVAGTGDFNGDGTTDILWRNTQTGDLAIWLFNNGQISPVGIGSVGASTWSIVGTGDFNRDGQSDILWRDASGNLAIWLMSNAQFLSGATIAQVPAAWSVVETGDFNGSGTTDILWLDTAGNVALWLMEGVSIASTHGLGNVGTNWKVQGLNAD